MCEELPVPPARGIMRLLPALPVLSLLLGARASSLDSRGPASNRLNVREPIVDVCASINAELVVPDLLGILTAVGVVGEFIFSSSSLPRS